MKPNLQENKNNNSNVELGQELGLSQEAMEVLLATKAGGMITKNLVELGETMLVEESKNKK